MRRGITRLGRLRSGRKAGTPQRGRSLYPAAAGWAVGIALFEDKPDLRQAKGTIQCEIPVPKVNAEARLLFAATSVSRADQGTGCHPPRLAHTDRRACVIRGPS